MLKKIGVLVLVSALAGCATSGANFRPVVDLKGQDPAVYDQNLRECQQYALQVSGAADRAVAGAVAGALLGVAFAAIGGGSRNVGAGIGGLSGATSGAAAGENSQRSIISRCLAGRGFSVLN